MEEMVQGEVARYMKGKQAAGPTHSKFCASRNLEFAGTCHHPKLVCFVAHNSWIFDTGAKVHLYCDKSLFKSLSLLFVPVSLFLPNGTSKLVHHSGIVRVTPNLELNRVSYTSRFSHNLISIHKLTLEHNAMVIFCHESCILQDRDTSKILAQGQAVGNLYFLDTSSNANVGEKQVAICSIDSRQNTEIDCIVNNSIHNVDINDRNLWHNGLGHPSFVVMKHIDEIDFKDYYDHDGLLVSPCDICVNDKQTCLSFPISVSKLVYPLEILHCDLWGPYKEKSLQGN